MSAASGAIHLRCRPPRPAGSPPLLLGAMLASCASAKTPLRCLSRTLGSAHPQSGLPRHRLLGLPSLKHRCGAPPLARRAREPAPTTPRPHRWESQAGSQTLHWLPGSGESRNHRMNPPPSRFSASCSTGTPRAHHRDNSASTLLPSRSLEADSQKLRRQHPFNPLLLQHSSHTTFSPRAYLRKLGSAAPRPHCSKLDSGKLTEHHSTSLLFKQSSSLFHCYPRRANFSCCSMSQPAEASRKPNRLAKEQSPYLLQHAYNPVDWYPWGEEAFAKARAENKLIFLSVGYSTCHWCHVMERESFENEEVAALMNERFVNVKVDREERPDVDKVYMTYVQATQGGGGWPMSVFLTPSLHPVLGGTYFPPEDKFGRVGFKTLLRRVSDIWKDNQLDLEESGKDVVRQLQEATETSAEASEVPQGLTSTALHKCYSQLAARYDKKLGGFGGAPKFPRPSELNLMLRKFHWGRQFPDEGGRGRGEQEGEEALAMALFTLQCMARGGMHDHIGGGFHRYSVDEFWHVPHFEKMLYDQGQLANTYLDAYAITRDRQWAVLARDILDYVLRDLTQSEGGFFSAEDADSLEGEEKKEGAFYVWTADEIEEILGKGSDRAKLFALMYYVKPDGNCGLSPRSDPHREFVGKNCLIQRQALEDVAAAKSLSETEAEGILAECRELLHRKRNARPRPHLDDKVIVAWNGLIISALARASRILKADADAGSKEYHFPVTGCEPSEYLNAATRAAEFIRSKLYNESTKQLKRSFRGAASEADGFADDYSFLIIAALDLFENSGGDTRWLGWALDLQQTQDSLFRDKGAGGFFSTREGDPSILLRLKEDYDGAEPSANSYAVANLARLSHYVGGEERVVYQEQASKTAASFQERLSTVPLALPQMCTFLPLLGDPVEPRQVIVVGPKQDPHTLALLTTALASPSPDKIVIPLDPSSERDVEFWAARNPSVLKVAGLSQGHRTALQGDTAAAFVCQNFTCLKPTSDPAVLGKILDQPQGKPQPEIAEIRL